MLAISTALQASLKAQQTYAGLVARGDEVLGQFRGQQDAPWARFDDEPAGARPRSAFDAVPESAVEDADRMLDPDLEADVAAEAALAEAVAAEALAAEAALAEDELAEDELAEDIVAEAAGAEEILVEAALAEAEAGAGLVEAALAEAEAELVEAELAQARAESEAVLVETEEDELAGADAAVYQLEQPSSNGQGPRDAGVDLPADGMALAADAAGADGTLAEDGYLAEEPPVPGYDGLSIPQLRGRLRGLSLEQVEALVGYERTHAARPPYLTMLENRLTTLRSR